MATDWNKELDDLMRRWREVDNDKSLNGMERSSKRGDIILDGYRKMYGECPKVYWEYVKNMLAPLLRPLYPLMLLLTVATIIYMFLGYA